MADVFELRTMKGLSVAAQCHILDQLTEQFRSRASEVDAAALEVLKGESIDLSTERSETRLLYFFLAVVAADIGQVPYREGRVLGLKRLTELAGVYGLSERKIVQLSVYAEEFLRLLSSVQQSVK